ncbi:hypothetical protein GCM10025864_37290 [Luteimicrobium album]|uniref:Uncharacterized protein n=1 Tax=Luteimicrobium album TaxID=1054550 RepID=A0ABQ6I645_9MICO|nr:hypothetical protein GCM10025864_37290 [Luteimicrobium album]
MYEGSRICRVGTGGDPADVGARRRPVRQQADRLTSRLGADEEDAVAPGASGIQVSVREILRRIPTRVVIVVIR